jgi:hypothetical protein
MQILPEMGAVLIGDEKVRGLYSGVGSGLQFSVFRGVLTGYVDIFGAPKTENCIPDPFENGSGTTLTCMTHGA